MKMGGINDSYFFNKLDVGVRVLGIPLVRVN